MLSQLLHRITMNLFFLAFSTIVLVSLVPRAETSLSLPSIEIADLPTGNYYYESTEPLVENHVPSSGILLRKRGFTVIGVYLPSRVPQPCFRGFSKGNRVINATRIYPPYAPDSTMESRQQIDLDPYARLDDWEMTERDRDALQTCIQVFWR